MSTRHSSRRGRIVVVVCVVGGLALMAAAVIPTLRNAGPAEAANRVGYVDTPSGAGRRAGCTGVRTDDVGGGRRHAHGRLDYPVAPPSGGPHNPDPLPDGRRYFGLDEAPAPERAVHNLEHGYVVVWFDRRVGAAELSILRDATRRVPRMIAVGWTRGEFDGPPLAVTAWGRTQRCARPDVALLREFTARHGDRSPERGGLGGSSAPASETGGSAP